MLIKFRDFNEWLNPHDICAAWYQRYDKGDFGPGGDRKFDPQQDTKTVIMLGDSARLFYSDFHSFKEAAENIDAINAAITAAYEREDLDYDGREPDPEGFYSTVKIVSLTDNENVYVETYHSNDSLVIPMKYGLAVPFEIRIEKMKDS